MHLALALSNHDGNMIAAWPLADRRGVNGRNSAECRLSRDAYSSRARSRRVVAACNAGRPNSNSPTLMAIIHPVFFSILAFNSPVSHQFRELPHRVKQKARIRSLAPCPSLELAQTAITRYLASSAHQFRQCQSSFGFLCVLLGGKSLLPQFCCDHW